MRFLTYTPENQALLFKLYFSTKAFEFCLQTLSTSLVETFLDYAGSAINEILSFLQTKTCEFLHLLDHLELLCTGCLKNYIERCLLFFSGCLTSTTSNYYSCSSGFDAIFFFQNICKFVNFLNCKVN